MSSDDNTPKKSDGNADELSRLLELELMQKRAAWQEASARRKTIKSLSIAFLFFVIMIALVGFYLVFTRVSEQRANQKTEPTPTPAEP